MAPTQGLTTTEAGGTATLTIVLSSQPTANVTIYVSSSDVAEGFMSDALLIFTVGNWGAIQTLTVTGFDDDLVDGNALYFIGADVVSSDTNFDNLLSPSVSMTNSNGEQPEDMRQRTAPTVPIRCILQKFGRYSCFVLDVRRCSHHNLQCRVDDITTTNA
jgi:hypothetical protein